MSLKKPLVLTNARVSQLGTGIEVQFNAGSAANPALVFGSDAASGLYSSGTNNLTVVTNGIARLSVSDTQISATLALDLGSHKITGLASGTVSTDAATFGQVSAVQTEVDAIETALALNSNGTFSASAYAGLSHVVTPSGFIDVFTQLDAAITAGTATSLDALTDVTITSVASGNVLYYNGSQWVNGAKGTVSGVQAWDADLDAVAALATTGLAARTGSGTWTTRSVVAPVAGITVTNGDGVAGDPTLVLADDLGAVEALSTSGVAVRTGTSTWVTRTITGTAGRLVVTDGAGIAANPTLDLATVTDSGAGTFLKLTRDAYGRITGTQAVVTADITGLVDSTYVNTSGDTMSGVLNMGSNQISGLAAGTSATDAVNKAQLDAAIAGLSWKNPVKAATTANITLSAPQTIDGISAIAGDRVLVKNQTVTSANGIYLVAAGAWTRTTDFDSVSPIDEINDAAVFVQQGTTNGGYAFVQSAVVATLGTDPIVFTQFTGASSIVAGIGLAQSGNVLSVNLGAGIAELPTDEVGLDIYNYTGSALAFANPSGGARAATTAGATTAYQLALFLDSTTLSQSGSGLKVAAGGITATELAASVAGAGLGGGAGTALSVNVDGSTLEINADTVRIKDAGVTNAKLANSTITFAGTSGTPTAVSLGGTVTVAAGLGMTTTASANTVTIALNATLDNLSDVVITSGATGDVVYLNGASTWVNGAPGITSGVQAYSDALASVAGLSSSGLVTINGTTAVSRTMTGTTNQITVTNGDGVSGNPTFAIASNAVLPGTSGVTLPIGTTAQETGSTNGTIRYNSDTNKLRVRENGSWVDVISATATTVSEGVTISLTNGNAGTISKGQIVYISAANTVDLANASADTTSLGTVGLVYDATIATAVAGKIMTHGVLTGLTGLTAGATYYLSTTAGALTTTAPSAAASFVVPIGVALSTTSLKVAIQSPIGN